MPLLLASTSPIRAALLTKAGVPFETRKAPVDEEALRAGLQAEGASPRDMADALAEAKARRVAVKHPEALVLGSDQILEFEGEARGKFLDCGAAEDGLNAMQGKRHMLHSAAVIYEDGAPVWRHVSTARLLMRRLSPAYIASYLDSYWEDVSYCAGGYRIEEEGARLFTRIDGDPFTIQGLPLLEIVAYLALKGVVEQ